jgi:ArsR family transcriptional regulator, arsenate/arsenite/antimonite-responsive transcriptional repressor
MDKVLNMYKALSDETRLKILKILEQGELCVCDIVAALNMIQPNISFHLGVLKEAGFIKDRRQGKWIHYRIEDSEMFRRFLILSTLERIPAKSVKEESKRLADFLKSKNAKGNAATLKKRAACCGRQE